MTCPFTTLTAGASTTCTATYTIDAADVAAGGVINSATVVGLSPDGQVIDTLPDTVVSPIGPDGAALEVDKRIRRVIDIDSSGTTNLGDAIVYEFEVTNTGRSS